MGRTTVYRPRLYPRQVRPWVPSLPALELEGWRNRNNDGTETTATFTDPQDTPADVFQLAEYRVRTIINNPPLGPFSYLLRARRKTTGEWFDVEPG